MNIEDASARQIAEYLNNLKDVARQNSRYDEDSGVWAQLYDVVFSENVSKKIFKRFKFDYYDPDTSYREDVCAFIDAFNEYAESISDEEGMPLFPSFEQWSK